MKNEQVFDPMKGTVSTGENVPAGNYTGKFVKVDHLPEQEPDPMTGKGGRQFASIRFTWEITDGAHKGKQVATESPQSQGMKSRFIQVVGWLSGKGLVGGESWDLSGCAGKQYLLTLGSKPGKSWIEVVNAMLIPNQS